MLAELPAEACPAVSAEPIRDGELASLFSDLETFPSLALAVSGGPDSLALLHLVARWAAGRPAGCRPTLTCLTVDHGLRPESAAEAAMVGRRAAGLGIDHRTLTWLGTKPRQGIQAAARAARYRLMTAACRELGAADLVLAHTLDDQAETLLMRLARGSGLDGLAAMSPLGERGGIRVHRPLLSIVKARLVATLAAAGLDWLEDPSNESTAFERVRLRRVAPVLHGVGLESRALATSARRLARARLALETAAATALGRHGVLHAEGYARLRRSILDEPEEIALRVLARVLAAIGGGGLPVRLARLEALLGRLQAGGRVAATLQGCRILTDESGFLVLRETGRLGLPSLILPAGASLVWDGRFQLVSMADLPCGVGPPAAGEIARLGPPSGLRRLAAAAAPVVRLAGQVLAAPGLGITSSLVRIAPIGLPGATARWLAAGMEVDGALP